MKQFYENSAAFDLGKTTMQYDGVDIVLKAFTEATFTVIHEGRVIRTRK